MDTVEGEKQFKVYILHPGKISKLDFGHISPQTFYFKAQ